MTRQTKIISALIFFGILLIGAIVSVVLNGAGKAVDEEKASETTALENLQATTTQEQETAAENLKATASEYFKYEILDDGTAEIKDYTGTDTDIIIPSIIDGFMVTKIGMGSFYEKNLTSLNIPDTVTFISGSAFQKNNLVKVVIPSSVEKLGAYAFSYNADLAEIEVDSENPNFKAVDNVIFSKDETKLVYRPEGLKASSLTIPSAVLEISQAACFNNSLVDVIIPDYVTEICADAFANNKLTNVIIPQSVTEIGNSAFRNNSISEVYISDSVEDIGGYAFADNKLDAVVIPKSVKYIQWNAFLNNSLTSAFIPDSVTSIGERAFGFNVDEGGGETMVEGFVVYGNAGSAAEIYANENGFEFKHEA